MQNSNQASARSDFNKFHVENLTPGGTSILKAYDHLPFDVKNSYRQLVLENDDITVSNGFKNIGLIYSVPLQEEIVKQGKGLEVSLHRNIYFELRRGDREDKKRQSMRNHLANQIHDI